MKRALVLCFAELVTIVAAVALISGAYIFLSRVSQSRVDTLRARRG
jgi:hypothetical protein